MNPQLNPTYPDPYPAPGAPVTGGARSPLGAAAAPAAGAEGGATVPPDTSATNWLASLAGSRVSSRISRVRSGAAARWLGLGLGLGLRTGLGLGLGFGLGFGLGLGFGFG